MKQSLEEFPFINFPLNKVDNYANIPREQWLSNICNCKVIGNEYHYYLFACEENNFKECRENFIEDLRVLNINFNLGNFDYKTLLYHILLLINNDSIFNYGEFLSKLLKKYIIFRLE